MKKVHRLSEADMFEKHDIISQVTAQAKFLCGKCHAPYCGNSSMDDDIVSAKTRKNLFSCGYRLFPRHADVELLSDQPSRYAAEWHGHQQNPH